MMMSSKSTTDTISDKDNKKMSTLNKEDQKIETLLKIDLNDW